MAYRFSDLVKPRNVDENGATIIVGKTALFRKMVASAWIKPVVAKHSCTLYAQCQVQACCDLLEQGYYPGENEPDKAVIRAAMDGAYKSAYVSE